MVARDAIAASALVSNAARSAKPFVNWRCARGASPLSRARGPSAGDEPTGHTTPYMASCGGGMSGSGAVRESEAGDETGVTGKDGAAMAATSAVGVAAVQDWHPQPSSLAPSVAAAVTVGAPAALADTPTVDDCIALISPRVAHGMPPPSKENSEPYAEQPRHHTVMNAVQRAVRRARRERERGIVRER